MTTSFGIEMRGIHIKGNWIILVAIAAASLTSMIAAYSLDMIVTHDFYLYGLQFSYRWAIPYWNIIGIIFGMSWINIIAAIGLQIYFTRKTKEEPEEQRAAEPASEELSNTFTLSDGSTIKVKHKLKSAKRLEKYDPDGIPIYVVDYDNIVQVLSVPEKLVKKSKEPSA